MCSNGTENPMGRPKDQVSGVSPVWSDSALARIGAVLQHIIEREGGIVDAAALTGDQGSDHTSLSTPEWKPSEALPTRDQKRPEDTAA